MIGWTVKNFISEKVNVFYVYKALRRLDIEYCTQDLTPVLRHGN